METILIEAISPHINATLFGYETPKELFEAELHKKNIVDTPMSVILEKNRRTKRTDDAVMYVNLNTGATENACPSIADSSAVSLAQMAFLSMTVSIFTVVATVANNLNNNNNNINSNNLNFVQQKQNSLSMNQNIVNQIMVDLPPPIPGKRAWEPFLCEDPYCSSQEYHENIVKSMLKKKIHEYKECGPKDYTPEAAEAIMNILRGLHTNQKWEYLTSPNKRECLGRELCLRSLKSHQNDEGLTSVQTVGYMLESFALLYHEIDDHSLSFAQFIEMMTERGGPQTIEDCFALFENCGNEEIYQMYSM